MIMICKAVQAVETTKELMDFFKTQNEPCYFIAVDVDPKKNGKDTEIVAELKVRETNEILEKMKISDDIIQSMVIEKIKPEKIDIVIENNYALDYAIELAKRDEAMKVVRTENEGFIELQCPECYHDVSSLDDFCSSCGQRLDWSDEE